MIPIIAMFSGTGELARAVAAGLEEPTRPVSFSDDYGPARKYLSARFPDAEVHKDFREQIVPEKSVVTIGAPVSAVIITLCFVRVIVVQVFNVRYGT